MSPILFPLLLLLFSECSSDATTKLTARILLYGYSFSIILFSMLPPTDTTILLAGSPHIISYLYLVWKVKLYRVRFPLLLLTLLQSMNFISLYYNSYEIILNIPFYLAHSNMILRETAILSVALCTDSWKVDTNLKVATFGLYITEYIYIMGF